MNWTTEAVSQVYRRQGLPNPVESACGEGPKRSKYYNKGVALDGHLFASGAEADAYRVLKIAEQAGVISGLTLQPVFLLQEKFTDADGKKHRKVEYRGDFQFIRKGKTVVVEVKGYSTAVWRVKEKLFRAKYGSTVSLEIWKK